MKNNDKLYKVYHRSYHSIEEFYDDLKDSVLNIKLEKEKIVVFFNSDVLEIELSKNGGYYTWINGEKENVVWDDQDLYPYVLEFVREQRKDTRR